MHDAITEKSIERATMLFWEQMLAMSMRAMNQSACPEDSRQNASSQGVAPHLKPRCIGEKHVVGSCSLSGAWRGRIEVRLSASLSIAATAAMLMQPAGSLEHADILDAVREIANMTAGTIKSSLPRPCIMTVPEAAHACVDFCVLPRTEDSVSAFFDHPEGELMVRVFEECREYL